MESIIVNTEPCPKARFTVRQALPFEAAPTVRASFVEARAWVGHFGATVYVELGRSAGYRALFHYAGEKLFWGQSLHATALRQVTDEGTTGLLSRLLDNAARAGKLGTLIDIVNVPGFRKPGSEEQPHPKGLRVEYGPAGQYRSFWTRSLVTVSIEPPAWAEGPTQAWRLREGVLVQENSLNPSWFRLVPTREYFETYRQVPLARQGDLALWGYPMPGERSQGHRLSWRLLAPTGATHSK